MHNQTELRGELGKNSYQLVATVEHTDLNPIGENLTISTVSDKLFWKLRHLRIQIVHQTMHDSSTLLTLGRIGINRISSGDISAIAAKQLKESFHHSLHFNIRSESVHVNVAIAIELIN